MGRHFSQAQDLILSRRANRSRDTDEGHGEVTRLIDHSASELSQELSCHICPYITNSDDVQEQNEQHARLNSNTTAIDLEANDASPSSRIPRASDHIPDALGLTSTSERRQIIVEPSTKEQYGELGPQ